MFVLVTTDTKYKSYIYYPEISILVEDENNQIVLGSFESTMGYDNKKAISSIANNGDGAYVVNFAVQDLLKNKGNLIFYLVAKD